MSVINQLTATKQTRGDSAPGKTAGPHASFQAEKREPKKDGKPILAARNVFKSYRKGKLEVPVLRGVDFSIRPGEFTAVIGGTRVDEDAKGRAVPRRDGREEDITPRRPGSRR